MHRESSRDWRETWFAGELMEPGLTLRNYMTFERDHFYYAIRLIGALLVAILVPLLIDRRFRR
jgi:hypothetical protein